jgi:UDP-glucose 4-epimerase
VLRLGNMTAQVSSALLTRQRVRCRGDGERARESVTVNLGTGAAHSITDVVQSLSRIAARDVRVELDESRLRASDNPVLLCDNTRMRRRFGWQPTYDLDAALRDLWRDPDLPDSLIERYAR